MVSLAAAPGGDLIGAEAAAGPASPVSARTGRYPMTATTTALVPPPASIQRCRTARAHRVPGLVPRADKRGIRAGSAPVHDLVPRPLTEPVRGPSRRHRRVRPRPGGTCLCGRGGAEEPGGVAARQFRCVIKADDEGTGVIGRPAPRGGRAGEVPNVVAEAGHRSEE